MFYDHNILKVINLEPNPLYQKYYAKKNNNILSKFY